MHWLKRRPHLERGLRLLEIMTFVIVAATLLWPLASVAMLLALLAMIGLVQELYPRP